jgi:gliding motility-associated-like protein
MQRKNTSFALLYVITLIFIPINIKSQINANFSSVQTIGCSPLMVEFNDLSTGSNIIYRKWEFGNGNISIGNNSNPSVIYNSSGLYSITLTISDGIDTASITKSNLIHVTPPPTASIILPFQNGCVPFSLTPLDNSTPSGAPIISWEWHFDDGSLIDSNQNTTHTYYNNGSYSISLKITDSLGCSDYTTISQPFVAHKPQSNFTSINTRFACSPPLNVHLSSLSNGIGSFSYFWNVNNQTFTSSQVNTVINQTGNYDVELIVTDPIGCKDTLNMSNYLQIGSSSTSMNIPDTTCRNTIETFSAMGLTNTYFIWDFGDGQTGVGNSTSHGYAYPGTFTVTLIANHPGGCTDTLTQPIVVETVSAAFTSSPHYSCQKPMPVNFLDQSTGNIINWEWKFGANNGSSSVQNPTHTIQQPGIYTDTLTVTTAFGCKSEVVHIANDSLIVNQANFIPSISEGCAPLTVQFQNTTPTLLSLQTILWDFNFGAVSPTVNNQISPTHVFTVPGIYKVKLTTISYSGCQTTIIKTIKVGSHQTASFTLDTNLACGSKAISCINNSSYSNLINYYQWNFGDGTYSSAFQPQHLFKDTGYLDVSLIVGYNGCMDTARIDSAIYIKSPILDFSYKIDCSSPNNVSFYPSSLGGTNFYWNFGDGTPIDSVHWNHIHQFPPNDGDYNITFSGKDTNSGCQYLSSNIIKVRYLQGQISSSDSIACLNDSITFSTLGSVNVFGSIDWARNSWANMTSGINTNSFQINQRGSNTVYAIVHDINGCADTLSQNILSFKPVAQIAADTTIGCAPFSVLFSDSSTSDTNITSYVWNFGDGLTSTLQNINHTFINQQSASYNINLTVTDTFGCFDQITEYNYITTTLPNSFFNADVFEICASDTIHLTDVPTGNFTYQWNFGDSTSSSQYQPYHSYQTSGVFDISLSVTDSNGCTNTYTRPSYVTVHQIPTASFSANQLTTTCYPSSIIFNNPSSLASNWEWNFGDSLGNRITQNGFAQHLYHHPGLYDIFLKVTSPFGCSDSLTKTQYISIQGPTAQIDLQPNIGCTNKDFNFDVIQTNSAAQIFTWDFGDGNTQTIHNQTSAIPHTYNHAMNYDVTLLTSDSLGMCIKTDQTNVRVIKIEAGFDMSHQFGCTPVNLNLTNKSIGQNKQIWFVDGIAQNSSTNPNMNLISPGIHQILLTVWNDSVTCRDSIQKQIEIFPLPRVKTSNDTSICYGDSIQFVTSGADVFQWFPSQYLTLTSIPDPISYTTSSMQYTVQGTDSNNCINTDTINIDIVQFPKIISFPSDITLYDGQSLNVSVETNQKLNYQWSSLGYLSCDDCKEPTIETHEKNAYSLHYEDLFQCFSGDTSFIVDIIDFNVYIPNSFTPNNDGNNDFFMLASDGVDRLMYMYVYDYWGTLVYESTDLNQGWDGTYNGQTLNGNTAYAYKIKVIGYSGRTAEFMGTVNLISR